MAQQDFDRVAIVYDLDPALARRRGKQTETLAP
jgi:hypothetical protein